MNDIISQLIIGYLPFIIVLLIIIIICKVIEHVKFPFNRNSIQANKQNTIYETKPIMTEYERNFYNILKNLENEYEIIPQLNLASIINKKNNNKYYSELFRNIDFAIFDKDFNKILLLIEIDDKTHTKINRQDRDLKVKKICNDANIKLIKFYTKYPNEQEYVLNRIKKELKKDL